MSSRRRPARRRRNQNQRLATRRAERRRALFHEPLEERRLLSAVSLTGVPSFVEQGPRPMIDNQNTVINPPINPAAGAVQSIAVNPNLNPDGTSQIFLATVDGGVWRTNNASTTNPAATTWTPLTDQMGSLATSSIAFSPLDPTENTLFAGSSSLSAYGDADGQPIVGVLRTTDGGNTWKSFAVSASEPTIKTVLPTAINLASSGPAQEMVLVAGINPHGGLYRSDDNGQTYTLLSGANGLPIGAVTQVLADPSNAQRFYAAVPGAGVFQGDFDPSTKVVTWTPFNTNIPAASISSSKEIQLAATNAGGTAQLYVGLADGSQALSGVFRSSDSSANWASLGTPAGFVAGAVDQHGFNMVGDPTDNQIVYMGGLGSIGAGGVIFRYDPGTSSWVNITGPGANGSKPHDDSREMAFLGNNVLVEACDGGFDFLPNPRNASSSQWGSFNGEGANGQGLGANEVHNVAWDSNSKVILAGAQDDGSSFSQVINTSSSQISGDVWTQITAGDGGDVAVDNFTLASVGDSIRYASSQGNSTPNPLDALTRQAFNAAGSPVGPLQSIVPQGLVGFNGLFITPTVLNAVAPTAAQLAAGQSTRMVIGGYQSANPIYESNNVGSAPANAITWTAVPVAASFSGTVAALAYGGVHAGVPNPDVLYAADDQDHVFLRTTAGGMLSPTASPFPGKEVRAISLDPTDWMHAFVASASGVWETTDAGQSWTPRTGNLVNSNLRSVEYVHLASGDVVLVGGQGGVYRMFLDNPGVWTKLGLNLPNDIAYDVDYSPASDVLVVGTFGRGAWTISQASTALSAPPVMQITGDQDAPGENDAFRLVRDPNNPLLLDVFVNNNTTVPDEQLPLASLQQINVDGLGGNDTLIVDDSNGLINVIGGIHYDGGTGFNTLQIVQTGGATQTSDAYSVGPSNGEGSDVITGPTGTQTIQFQDLAPVLDTVPATTAMVNGTPADNATTYTTGSVAANGLVTIDNQESYEFSNKVNLVINGGAGSNTITLNNQKTPPTALTGISIDPGATTISDTLVAYGIVGANDRFGLTPSGTGSGTLNDVLGSNFVPATFSGLGGVTLIGQKNDADGLEINSTAGNDAFTYTPGATGDSGTETGTANSGAFDLTPITFSGMGSYVKPLTAVFTGAKTLTINGTAADDTIGFSNQPFPPTAFPEPDVVINGGTPIFFDTALTKLVLNGLGGNDTVNVAPTTPLANTTINLGGNAVTTGEVVNLTGDGTPATVALSGTAVTINGGGLGTVAAPLTITGAGAVNFDNGAGSITFGGTAIADALNITPTSANTAAIQVNGVSPVLNATTTGILAFGEPTPDGDTVTVNGTSANDTINVVRGAATTVQVNSLKTISLATASTEALVVATGAGTDRVNVSGTAGPASLAVNGGAAPAVDTLTVTNSTAGTTTVVPGATPDAGTVQTPDGNVGFTGMTLVTLAGAAAGDTLVAKGTNSADNMALQFLGGANRMWVNSQAVVSFSSFGIVTLQGLFGDDKFSVTPVGLVGVTAINIAGGDPTASDSLLVNGTTGADAIGFAPTAADAGTITVNAAAPVAFGSTESVTINGLGGGDALTVTTPAGPDTITYSPGATVDSAALKVGSLVPMNFMNLGAGSVQLADTSGGAVDSLVYGGTAASDTFNVVAAAGGTIILNSQIPVMTPGIANLALNGLAGDDTFNLNGTLPFATTTLDGGDPSSSDIANLTGASGAVAVNLGDSSGSPPINTTITGYGGTVTLTGVEVANLDAGRNGLTVNGGAHNDTMTYTPTGAAAGTVTDAGLNTTFNFTNALGAFTIDPAGGNNAVTVNGTNSNDTINVVRGASTTIQVNSLKTVSLVTANAEALVVATGAGTDRVNVSGTAGPASLTVNGGATPAADTLTVSNSTAGTTTVVPGATPDAGTVQTPDGNVGFTGMTLVTLAGAAAGDTLVAKGTNSADNMALQFLGGANRIWVNSQAVVSFSSFGTVTLQGLFGDDKFSVTPVGLVGVTAINIAGGDPTASDSLLVNGTTGADTIGFAPTAADAGMVTVNAAAPITFSTTESVTINGLGGGDALMVTTPAGPDTMTYNPGPTVDSAALKVGSLVPMNFMNLGAGSVQLADTSGGAVDSLVYSGTAASDTFNVVGAAGGTITLNSQIPVMTPGIANLMLNGLAGDDTFNLTGTLPFATTTLDGGDPSSSDIANLTGATGAVAVNLGDSAASPPSDTTITGYGGTVTLTGVEVANLDAGGNGLAINGTAHSDMMTYTPTGAASGTVTNAGLNTTFNFTNAAGAFTIDPAGGNNSVAVNGTSGNDTIDAARGLMTTVQVNSLKTVSLISSNTGALFVTTGAGTDRVNVSGTGGPASLTVNGGATPAADTLTVTNSTTGTTTVVPGATPDAGTVQTPDGNVGFTGMTLVMLTGAAVGDTLVAKGTNSADNMALQFLGGANRIWVNSQAVVSFSSFGTVTLQGLFGDDKFSVTPVGLVGVTAINVAGGDPTASDSLLVNGTTGADTIGFAPTAADAGTVTVNAAAPIAFSTTESVTINGLGGGDALTVALPAGPNAVSTLTPGATFDSGSLSNSNATEGTLVPLAFSHLGFGGGLTVNDIAGPIDTLVYNGLSAGDIFQVNGAVITLDSQLPVRGPGVSNLSLVGQGGSDRFVVAGPVPYFTTLIGGGESSTDIANLDGATGPVILAFGNNVGSFALINGYGGAVSVTGIGNVNFDAGGNALTAFAGKNDSVTYTPTGTAAGTLTDSGPKTTFNFANVAGTFNLVDGAGGTNQLTVNGTGSRDLFEIDQGARTVQVLENNVSALKAVNFDPNFSTLNAVGLSGRDTFQVIPAAGLPPFPLDNLVINIDGDSGPTGANNALVLGNSFITGAGTPTPLPANSFVVDNRQGLNSGTLRVYQSGVANPDIHFSNIQVVSPSVAGPGNLLVMGPDTNEPNETQAGAAILGPAQTTLVPHATIFPDASEFPGVPADQDYYSVTAQQTGTLDFVATFRLFNPALLPGGGNLNLQVLDAAGNVIATASGGAATFGAVGALPAGSARIRIPAVAGQTYFLHVFGANLNGLPNGAVVNGYDLSVVDTPSAVPFGIELSRGVAAGVAGSPDTADLPPNAPADDTGRSQFDNVTNNNKPRVYLRLADGTFLNDLPGNSTPGTPPVGVIPIPFSPNATTAGFRVAIFDGDNTQTPVGFATQVFGVPGLYAFDFPNALADGVHHLTAEVQMVDPATPAATGFGGASASFDLTVDTAPPPVMFGSTGVATSGLDGPSDSGVNGQPDTIADRITNGSTPTLYGVAEANAIVRLYDDVNNNGVVDAGDVFLGQTTAVPGDGTNANPNGQWRITSNVDLNDPKLGFPLDGVRHLVATAEDLAGNLSLVQSLTIFVDTQGPRVNNVGIAGSPGFNLFLNKLTTPPVTAPTPIINGLDITFHDQPIRVGPDFVYPAANPTLATTVGNYSLVGEHAGKVQISSITFADSTATGTPGMSVATLHFAAPLADDRYTLTISDRITDNAGNPLDAEFNGATFPAGNGNSGGSFVGSFTVNSRPHIGVYSAGTVDLDLNGNGTFDPQNPDSQNRDAVITLGYASDRLFSGKFADASGAVNGFDKLAAYGFVNGQWRWIFDQGGLGSNEVQVPQAIPLDGLPVAGNWTNTKGGADHVGVFTGDTWWLDVLGQGTVTAADLATPATAANPAGRLPSDMVGLPVVGDFDGDGKIDLATYQNGVFEFDLSSLDTNGIVTGQWNAKINVQPLLPNNIGFSGVLARPVAADMNRDGTTDIGLYWPGRTDSNPGTAQWYFLVSDPAAATPAAKFASLNQTFQDETLGGRDHYYQFGDQFALPLVGNFDPPSSGAPAPSFSSTSAAADWIARLYVQILGREPGTGDLTNWINQVNQGLTPTQVAQSFVDSAEHRAEVIDQLYQQYLGRHADAEGSAFWISVWNAAGGPELVQAGIIGSPEYYATAGKLYPNLSADAAWVTALYRNILGRDVDQKGLDYWVDYIQSHSKQSVVLGFVTSDEYRLQLIAGWFETYLGRAIDQTGAAYWLHQLQQGLAQDQIAIGILSSDEYRDRA